MMRSRTKRAILGFFVVQSAIVLAQKPHPTSLRLSPAQAVINAAEIPAGVGGVFELVVRSTGRQGQFLYLHSEADYRDPRNLTIAIALKEERALAERLSGPVELVLLRKVIAVRGVAKKTRIDFTADGRPTGKYYYQTQLSLGSARDLTMEGERSIP